MSLTQLTKRSLGLVGAACALLLGVAATGHGSETDVITKLTFDRAVAIPGVVLPAGRYTFEAIRPDIVRVSSRDGRKLFYMGFAHQVPRPAGLGRASSITLGEARDGEPRPITVWYPEQRSFGYRLIY